MIGTGLLVVGSLASMAVADDSPQNPQSSSNRSGAAAAAAVPASCLKLAQPAGTGGQHYRNVLNAPFTHTVANSGNGWFNLACGSVTFTVPRGQQALVSLEDTAEHDCNAPTATANGWCQTRFLVNGKPALPDNTGRGDTYAQDSTNGGSNNWSAHTLSQALVVSCPRSTTTTTPCSYRVQEQGDFENGATSWWRDDSTLKVDVTLGKVTTTSASVTP